MGLCFWPSSGEGKRRSCSPGCLPPESCVSIGGCRGGELFTVTLGGGPGMKPQMNSSCSGRSRLKQTAPRAGRALRRGPGREDAGHPRGAATRRRGPGMATVFEAPAQGLGFTPNVAAPGWSSSLTSPALGM